MNCITAKFIYRILISHTEDTLCQNLSGSSSTGLDDLTFMLRFIIADETFVNSYDPEKKKAFKVEEPRISKKQISEGKAGITHYFLQH